MSAVDQTKGSFEKGSAGTQKAMGAAAKGIGDVAFGGPSDQQEPNQIDMTNVAGLTAAGAGVAVAPGLVNQFRGRPNSAKSLLGMTALGAGGGALTSAIAQSL